MDYNKPWLSYSQQLDQLIGRGLEVSDKAKAIECLERIGYYRLSGYWFPFRERSEICCPLKKPTHCKKFKKGNTERLVLDRFQSGASFQQAVELYVFDKKLRLLTLDALERIEVALRVDISSKYGIQNGRIFASWLRSLNYLRNVCAHHSRLWNRNIIDQPKLPSATELAWTQPYHTDTHALARPYLLFCIEKHLLSIINPHSTWWQRFKQLLKEDFPELSHIGLNLRGMGIPESENIELEP